jgi:aldehyde dehydrogenase (NAD+)
MAPAPKTIKAGKRDVSIPTGLFIANEWVEASGKETFPIENPSTGEEIIRIQEGRAEDVDIAVKKARELFNSTDYREGSPVERGILLNKLADLMEEAKDDLIAIEMLDTGKTYKQASALDIPASIGTLRYYAGWADKIVGLSSFNVPKTLAYTRREPVGVCGQIIPWKYALAPGSFYLAQC